MRLVIKTTINNKSTEQKIWIDNSRESTNYNIQNLPERIDIQLDQETAWIVDFLTSDSLLPYTDKQILIARAILVKAFGHQDVVIEYFLHKKNVSVDDDFNYYVFRERNLQLILPSIDQINNLKSETTHEIIINNKVYNIPASIYANLSLITEIKESLPNSRPEIIVPDNYVPYIDGALAVLMKDKTKYNAGELSLLDFLGFPIMFIIDGFVFIDNKLLHIKEANNHYTYAIIIMDQSFMGCIRYNLSFDKNYVIPFDDITLNVAKLLIAKLGVSNYKGSSTDNDEMVELLLLKTLIAKYGNKYLS